MRSSQESPEARELVRNRRLRTKREEADLSRADLARAVDVDVSTVARWEKGLSVPRGGTARRLSEWLLELQTTVGPQMPRQLVPLRQVVHHRPWATERLLRRLVAEHRVPYDKLGPGPRARVLFDLADLDALAEAGRVEARR